MAKFKIKVILWGIFLPNDGNPENPPDGWAKSSNGAILTNISSYALRITATEAFTFRNYEIIPIDEIEIEGEMYE